MKKRYAASAVSVLALAVLLLFYAVSLWNRDAADWISFVIGGAVRTALGTVTSLFPFSLAEFLLLALPFWIFLVARYLCRVPRNISHLRKVLMRALSVLFVTVFLFFATLGVGYRTTPLEERLGLSDQKITVELLQETSEILTEQVNLLAKELSFGENGFSFSPISFSDLSASINSAFLQIRDEAPFLAQFYSKPKPLFVSEPFSYTNITGVYSFFTGEANINVNYPDYTVPFTVAHEMAHQRGISREDEANFIAFLVCAASDEAYIRYSGYLNLLEYVNNALAHSDEEAFALAWNTLAPEVRGEIRAYNAFYQKYQNTVVKDVFEAVNDAYLKGNGTDGVVSYGMVSRLACLYFAGDSR